MKSYSCTGRWIQHWKERKIETLWDCLQNASFISFVGFVQRWTGCWSLILFMAEQERGWAEKNKAKLSPLLDTTQTLSHVPILYYTLMIQSIFHLTSKMPCTKTTSFNHNALGACLWMIEPVRVTAPAGLLPPKAISPNIAQMKY